MNNKDLELAIDKIGSKLGLKDTPITDAPLNPPANLDGTSGEEKKDDKSEADRVAQEIQKQAELEESNRVAAEKKKADDESKKAEELKAADIEDFDDEDKMELSDEDRAYLEELEGKKKDNKSEGKKEDEDEEKPSAKKTKTVDDEELVTYKTKASEYEKILTDPLTKAFLEFRKNGGDDINAFAKEVGLTDINSFTPEQLYEQDLKSLAELSEDEMKEEMDRFAELSKVEKLRLTKDIKNRLMRERDEKLTTFSATINKQAEAERAFEQQAIQKGVQELDSTLSKMEGNKYKGLKVTPEVASKIRQYVSQNTVPMFENGKFVGYDIETSVRNAMYINYGSELIKVAAKMAKANAIDKALKLRQRPNRVETTTSGQLPSTKKDIREIAKEAGQDQWKMRNGGRN